VLQSVRSLEPCSPAAVVERINERDSVSHAFGAVFTTMRRLHDKGHLSIERGLSSTASGRRREMDAYSTTVEGLHAAASFQKSIQNFMLPESGE